jgi:hypothetical protein
MDTIDLSLKMKRLTVWLDQNARPDSLVRKQFNGTPFGNGYVTIDPGHQGELPSTNHNRVYLCGTEAGMQADSVGRLIELFAAENVKQFFVWLSPGPDMDRIRGWLEGNGLSRIRRTGYPTLCREGGPPPQFRSDLEVRQVSAAEIEAAREPLGKTLWPEFTRSAGRPGFYHYMAFDGARPVAVAALAVFEGLGYLMAAATAEGDRQRGAQQALIARRIARAEQLGCAVLVSETLYFLEHSLRNLQRAGFREAYEKEVYQWSADA